MVILIFFCKIRYFFVSAANLFINRLILSICKFLQLILSALFFFNRDWHIQRFHQNLYVLCSDFLPLRLFLNGLHPVQPKPEQKDHPCQNCEQLYKIFPVFLHINLHSYSTCGFGCLFQPYPYKRKSSRDDCFLFCIRPQNAESCILTPSNS